MNPSYTTPIPTGHSWPRHYLIDIFQAALATGEYRFARQTALSWLAAYPGDLPVKLLRSKALIAEGHPRQALPILRTLCLIDPEYREAQELCSKTSLQAGFEGGEATQGCVLALGGIPQNAHPRRLTPKTLRWCQPLSKTRKALARGNLRSAEAHIQGALAVDSPTPLTAVTHLQILRTQKGTPTQALHNLAEHYHQRWPDCLFFVLVLAETLMEGGESGQAVALLHQAASQDVTGQVATRLWGEDHPYRSLWPEKLEAMISSPIPASVAAHLGWNLLPSPSRSGRRARGEDLNQAYSKVSTKPIDGDPKKTPSAPRESTRSHPTNHQGNPPQGQESAPSLSTTPETLKSIQDELEQVANRLKQPSIAHSDGRFPVYVVFSTQKGLQRKYGVETAALLDEAMRRLVAAVRKRLDWGATLVYADDPGSMAQFGLKPVQAYDAWKLKLALVDLDTALGQRGARIGALLIVGGPEVVPFHHLPNPTDDSDADVPSDSPYATRDENYFVPEWPVGRLPGGAGKDPGVLFSVLRNMTARHATERQNSHGWLNALWNQLILLLTPRQKRGCPSFGYSAEAWRRASISVFRPIGEPRALVTSPPVTIHQRRSLPITKLGYFNLHGVVDSAEWFGQRDPSTTLKAGPSTTSSTSLRRKRSSERSKSKLQLGANSPGTISETEYPVALHPEDVTNSGHAPQVIFSEACYGANVLKKSVEEALCLKFLASGSQALAGSTAISYGSVTTPLNAADLLGKAFWRFLKDGYPAGEALRRAKIYLASEMHRRQGYLDGEDQKTLISFVLYGDPLAQLKSQDLAGFRGIPFWGQYLSGLRSPKSVTRSLEPPPQVKTICDRAEIPGTSEPIPQEVMAHVKNVVEQYLPGMRGARLSMSHEHAGCCCQSHTCPTSQLGAKARPNHLPERRVVTLNKQVTQAKRVHEAYARLTLDKQGKVVKLAVSR